MTLVKGLAHVRQRYSSDTSRIWTLSEINLAFNALGDEGLGSVLGWAKKDLGCRKLLLQGNDIKVSPSLVACAYRLTVEARGQISFGWDIE